MLGQEAQESFWEGIQAQGQGFVNNDIQTLNNANSIVSYDAYQGSTSLNSYFGRANYSFKNKYSLNIKNLNSLGKNISDYKSSPQIEFSSLAEFKSSIPLIKKTENYLNLLTPKISLRANPGDMKNHKTSLYIYTYLFVHRYVIFVVVQQNRALLNLFLKDMLMLL